MRGQITRSFFTEQFSADHPDRVDSLVAAFWDGRPDLEEYLKHVAARQAHRTTERLTEINRPTLVLIGDADTHAGGTGSHWDQSQYLASAIRDAELHVIAGAKHGIFWSHPDDSAAVIDAWTARIDRTVTHG